MEYLDRQVDSTLSGGEMKRIEIATILARKTGFNVFDEPEAGIDLWSFSMLVQQFEKIHEKKEQSLILISHQERILDIADEIVVIKDHGIYRQGTPGEILTVDLLAEVFGVKADVFVNSNGISVLSPISLAERS